MLEIFKELIKSTILIIELIIFAIILLDIKKMKFNIKKVLSIIISVVIYSVIILMLDGTIKTLLLSIIYLILYNILFKISYTKSIFMVFLHAIILMISDTIFLLFVIYILKIDPTICYTQYTGALISNITVCIISISLVFLLRKFLKKLINIKINNSKLIAIYTILTLGCVVIIFYKATDNITVNQNLIEGIIVMLVFVVILYSLIKQKIENNKVLEKYDKLLEFIKKYESIIEEQKTLRHETKNQLITVKSKIENKEKNNIVIEYIDSLLNDYKSYNEEKYGKFQYLPANGIKGLFYYKAMEAEEKGIQLSINVATRVEKSILKELNTEDFKQLGRLIGVYLDNAIEASTVSEEKKLGIEIYTNKKDVMIVISNTYSGAIDTESVGKVRYSTKGNNRGHGLMLVNKILNASSRFTAERQVTDKLYIQKLIIKNSNL